MDWRPLGGFTIPVARSLCYTSVLTLSRDHSVCDHYAGNHAGVLSFCSQYDCQLNGPRQGQKHDTTFASSETRHQTCFNTQALQFLRIRELKITNRYLSLGACPSAPVFPATIRQAIATQATASACEYDDVGLSVTGVGLRVSQPAMPAVCWLCYIQGNNNLDQCFNDVSSTGWMTLLYFLERSSYFHPRAARMCAI